MMGVISSMLKIAAEFFIALAVVLLIFQFRKLKIKIEESIQLWIKHYSTK